jgi:hypothetical protein
LHPSLDDRVFDADEFGKACFQHGLFPSACNFDPTIKIIDHNMPLRSTKVYCARLRFCRPAKLRRPLTGRREQARRPGLSQ